MAATYSVYGTYNDATVSKVQAKSRNSVIQSTNSFYMSQNIPNQTTIIYTYFTYTDGWFIYYLHSSGNYSVLITGMYRIDRYSNSTVIQRTEYNGNAVTIKTTALYTYNTSYYW